MKIAFYRGLSHGNIVDRIICLATLSKYSHCEFVFSDGVCASATLRDGGVRFKKINLHSGRWDVYPPRIRNSDEELIRAFFNLNEGAKYDIVGAVGSWLGLDIGARGKFWCSEICAQALHTRSTRSPGGLYRKLLKTHMI